MTFKAKLVRGADYFFSGKEFRYGVWMDVTAEEMAHLKKYAVDPITVVSSGGYSQEFRDKFEYQGEPEPARTRSRKPAPEPSDEKSDADVPSTPAT